MKSNNDLILMKDCLCKLQVQAGNIRSCPCGRRFSKRWTPSSYIHIFIYSRQDNNSWRQWLDLCMLWKRSSEQDFYCLIVKKHIFAGVTSRQWTSEEAEHVSPSSPDWAVCTSSSQPYVISFTKYAITVITACYRRGRFYLSICYYIIILLSIYYFAVLRRLKRQRVIARRGHYSCWTAAESSHSTVQRTYKLSDCKRPRVVSILSIT